MRASARRALSTARPARASDVSLDLPRVVAGQPTRATHPHVIASAADLTPGVSRAEYAARRAALARAMPPHSAAIFAAAPALRWPGTAIPAGKYRQDADFAYYTGVTQPDCVAVVERGRTEDDVRYALIVPKRCERHAQWDGERIDARAGETVFGADAAYEADERAAAYATEAVRNARGGVFVDLDKVDEDASVVHRALGARARGGGGGDGVRPVRGMSHRLRWRKSDAELALIKNSVDLDVQAFVKAFQTSRAGATEADVMAQHEAACRIGGADRLAYPSVVGSGAGACVVHYHQNDKMLEDGDLLLMDAGCELNGYVSDITRTWPISGRWTQAQLDVYSVVLEAHDACLRAARVDGETSLMDIHRLSIDVLANGLAKLLPNTSARALIRSGEYAKYYPHSVGHWLGADTHDVPSVAVSTPFERNVAFTIEPGLYFSPHDLDVPADLRGIGVRIEDDCVVDANGAVVALSAALPTDPDAVAALASSTFFRPV
jgi:Xaa-Pro aminopeptidase|tara:strand:+ start:1004 stop:2482 length:1479 start_codon:yes stop_codon:yes gene_type:complete